jgi:hypothetical protein
MTSPIGMKTSSTFLRPSARTQHDHTTHSQVLITAALILDLYVGACPIFFPGVSKPVVIRLNTPALGSNVDLFPVRWESDVWRRVG